MHRSLRGPLTSGLLALVALVLAHHLILLAADGGRVASVAATRDGDNYWGSIELIVAAAAIGTIATGSRQLVRLHRQAGRVRLGGVVVPESGAVYLVRLLLPMWARVTILTGLLLLAQENLEHFAIGAPLPGLKALAPPDFELAWLIVVVVSGAVALVASLVRWRTLVLIARLRASSSARPRATSIRLVPRPPDWWAVAPLLARGLGLRAPPVVPAA